MKRVEDLRVKQLRNEERSNTLEERKRNAAVGLIRYKPAPGIENTRKGIENTSSCFIKIIANFILILSSVSAISALLILKGDTIHNLSYLLVYGAVVVCLALPCICSKISIKKRHIPYQTCLSLDLCLLFLCILNQGVLDRA